jgi:hypothetical protein
MPIRLSLFDLGETPWHIPGLSDTTALTAEASRRVRARLVRGSPACPIAHRGELRTPSMLDSPTENGQKVPGTDPTIGPSGGRRIG